MPFMGFIRDLGILFSAKRYACLGTLLKKNTLFLKLSRCWFTVSRSYLAFPVGIFEISLASLRRSQSTNTAVKASPIPI